MKKWIATRKSNPNKVLGKLFNSPEEVKEFLLDLEISLDKYNITLVEIV